MRSVRSAVAAVAVSVLIAVGPAAALAQPAPTQPVYQTLNGPRTETQLQQELLAAGYGGPWDVATMLAAYDRAAPKIAVYPDDASWHCFDTNVSCGRDPWWAESNTLQDDSPVTYPSIGAGLTTERRFGEAVDLLWQWPEGRALLTEADRHSVFVGSIDYDHQVAYASFVVQRNTIVLNRRIVTGPTWMVAATLAHELSHAHDAAEGLHQGATPSDCLAGETAAFSVQRRYLAWLTTTLQPAGLPPLATVTQHLTADQSNMAHDLADIANSSDLGSLVKSLYVETC